MSDKLCVESVEMSSSRPLSIAPVGWDSDSDSDNEPVRKKTRVQDKPRFQLLSTNAVKDLCSPKPPKSTELCTKWAVKNFLAWKEERNRMHSEEPVPDDLLESASAEEISKWLAHYVAETRNTQGEPYPPKTIYQLLTGILRHLRLTQPHKCPNFLDRSDMRFIKLHNAIDNVFKQLRKDGIGSGSKHAEIVTKVEENQLWEAGVLGTSDPKTLLHTVFYLNGKNFCLRGGQEHRELKISQLTRVSCPQEGYIYTENASKNRSGGFAQLSVEHKVVPVYASTAGPERCHVQILDLYLSKLPTEAIQADNFYVRPLQSVPKRASKPWFTAVPVGRNTLTSMFREMCADAGVQGHKTNHSLRATGASELFAAGVPERIIQERTGHRSLKALRTYERTSAEQHQAVSEILGSRTLLQYEEAIHKEVTLSEHSEPSQNYFNNCIVHVYQSGPPVAPTPQYSCNTSPHIAHDAVQQLLSGINLDDLLH